MEITLQVDNLDGGYGKFTIKAYCPFEMYGHTFAAHREIDGRTGKPKQYKSFAVTEISTGFRCTADETRAGAIISTKERLREMGEAAFLRSVKWAQDQISKGGKSHENDSG